MEFHESRKLIRTGRRDWEEKSCVYVYLKICQRELIQIGGENLLCEWSTTGYILVQQKSSGLGDLQCSHANVDKQCTPSITIS
jgi:hypothetical protein